MVDFRDKVKDPYTGIEGIVYAKTTYELGCTRISVQQPSFKDKEGNTIVPDLWMVDEPQLIIVKKGALKPTPKTKQTGGPSSFSIRK